MLAYAMQGLTLWHMEILKYGSYYGKTKFVPLYTNFELCQIIPKVAVSLLPLYIYGAIIPTKIPHNLNLV